MATRRIAKNISVDPELLRQFDNAARQHDSNRSRALRDCMRAYIDLTERCRRHGHKLLPTLEFKGCESDNDPTHLLAGISPPAKKKLGKRLFIPPIRELNRARPT